MSKRIIGSTLLTLVAAALLIVDGKTQVAPPSMQDITKRMALSGHGVLFDAEGRRVELKPSDVAPLQEGLLQAALEGKPDPARDPGKAAQLDAFVSRLKPMPKSRGSDPGVLAMHRHLRIVTAAERLPDEQRSAILWRADFILHRVVLRDRPLEDLLKRSRLQIDWTRWREILDAIRGYTSYMSACSAAGVPVPPDFATTGSSWTRQGNLMQNLLAPGKYAEVWTWAPPSGRGACVALPRRSGATATTPASVAGVICQSADTGNACFWDNIDRTTGARVAWEAQTMEIRKLQDGSNLSENCTGCHKGNNVYLLAPEDPTWCRLLRGGKPGASCAAPSGPNAANLSLQVEANVNAVHQPGTSMYHSRYRPLTGTPARPAWINDAMPGCGGMCHLAGIPPLLPPGDPAGSPAYAVPNPMPPTCGTNCY